MKRTCTTLVCYLSLVALSCAIAGHSQVISGPIAITGNSLVNFAPWQDSGIVPVPTIRGWDSLTCAMLYQQLPWNVWPGTKLAVLVLATNDVHDGISPADHMACVNNSVAWLLANRPGIKVVVANTPPFDQNNCYGDYRAQIAAYNALYASLSASYPPGRVSVSDVWTGAVQSDGWAIPALMTGSCGIHFGPEQQQGPGWAFFMGQIAAGIRSLR